MTQQRSMLIADGDPGFQRNMTGLLQPGTQLEFAADLRQAQLCVADRERHYAAICVNSAVCEPFSIPLLRFVRQHRPATPVYLMVNQGMPVPDPALLDQLQIQKCFQKPMPETELLNSIFPFALLEMEKLVNLARQDSLGVDGNLEAEDGGMHAISAQDFLCGSKSFFDVYVRLKAGKYVKVLKAGDQFDADRVKSYLLKGVTRFYMRKDAQELYLKYCDKITESILERPQVDLSVKVSQVFNFGKETSDFLQARGCDESSLQAAHQFVAHARKLTRLLQPSVLDHFLGKVGLCDHGTGTVMLVSLLFQHLGYQDEKLRDVIALSAMYHDLGLMHQPEKIALEAEDLFTPEERVSFEKHPEEGERIARGIRRLNPIVCQVILQHHERRDRTGFPLRLGPGAISPVAELVGMAELLHRLIQKTQRLPGLDPVELMYDLHFNAFSAKLVTAFQKVFPLPRKT